MMRRRRSRPGLLRVVELLLLLLLRRHMVLTGNVDDLLIMELQVVVHLVEEQNLPAALNRAVGVLTFLLLLQCRCLCFFHL